MTLIHQENSISKKNEVSIYFLDFFDIFLSVYRN